MNNDDQWIKFYFEIGLNQKDILACISINNSVLMSRRTLQRRLSKLHLYRRKFYSDILDVAIFVLGEVRQSGQMHGYRFMHLKITQAGFIVTNQTIRLLLQILDPDGVIARSRRILRRREYSNKGPNFLWHVDGYDKIKPYGICISGCIDGFSRYIIWMHAYKTNNDPKVIAGYFIDAVNSRQRCPQRMRCDLGTENVHIEQMQKFLRRNHTDEYSYQNSFLYGSSNHNQRIESWWGFLRKHMSQFWMNLFETLKEQDKFTGDFLDRSLVQFCFMDIIQAELNNVVLLWNTHKIRPQRNQNTPNGRPILMYFTPHVYGADDYLFNADIDDITDCQEETTPKQLPCDETVYEICRILMTENTLESPTDAFSAADLYYELRHLVLESI